MRRDGYSNPEIAETLDKSEGYVRKLVSESRKFFDEGNNSQFNATNSVYSEREQRPVERFATQAELERAVSQRFARRDHAFVARQARLRNPDATLAEWKEMYDV
jgi:IS30 family transposase